MYPNLYFFLKEALGIDEPWRWTRVVNSFGFFVAISFILAAVVLTRELKRRERRNLLFPIVETITVGKPATLAELLTNAILGFLIGYKLLGLLLNSDENMSPQDYIFSSNGNLPGGILLALVFAALKYWERRKQQLPKPEERKIRIWPHERVGDMTIYAAVFGFLGAKLFDNLENWDRFIQDPIGNLLSPSGLTFYGGLICAGAAIIIYAKRKQINLRYLVDAFAPALMLAYAIGRIGCQVSGDGDWGIPNSAYITDANGHVQGSDTTTFRQAVQGNAAYFQKEFGSLDAIHHQPVKAPSFLPEWFVAYAYPHNVNEQGFKISGCEGEFCYALPVPVFPTPIYETLTCLLLFGVLIWYRSRPHVPGQVFAVYLVMNGLERFFIEKIRVNTKYHIFGLEPTQAEIISLALVIAGIALFFLFARRPVAPKPV